jgi:hypothetical protein
MLVAGGVSLFWTEIRQGLSAVDFNQTRYRHARAFGAQQMENFKQHFLLQPDQPEQSGTNQAADCYFTWLSFNSVRQHHMVMTHADTGIPAKQMHQDDDSFVRHIRDQPLHSRKRAIGDMDAHPRPKRADILIASSVATGFKLANGMQSLSLNNGRLLAKTHQRTHTEG